MAEQSQQRPAGMDTWIRRRKTYIVDKKMQYTYIAMVISMVMVMIVGIAVSNLFMLFMYKNYLQKQFGYLPDDWKDSVWLFLLSDTTIVLLLIIAAVFYSVLHSHRIAGPIYRLKQSILRLQTGDFNFVVTFRQKDFLQDMAEEMNKFITMLQVRNDDLRKVRTRMDELGKRIQTGAPASEHIAELNDLSNQISQVVMVREAHAAKEAPEAAAPAVPASPPVA